MNRDIGHLREQYNAGELLESDCPANPMELFDQWFKAAQESGTPEPNAIALATSSLDGAPQVRIVLIKSYDEKGLVFYTNYLSKKGIQINANARVAGTMWWPPLQRQVRVEGRAAKVTAAQSDTYFKSRPTKSQMGAVASPQSQVIESRAILEKKLSDLERSHVENLSRPKHWGGYRIELSCIEFWQGRRSRLHDRIKYEQTADHKWTCKRLAP